MMTPLFHKPNFYPRNASPTAKKTFAGSTVIALWKPIRDGSVRFRCRAQHQDA
jgi:hypothetical protein